MRRHGGAEGVQVNRVQKVLNDAIVWHAARVLSGARSTKADAYLHRSVARYLQNKRPRDARRVRK
jgi:hypothetical protein